MSQAWGDQCQAVCACVCVKRTIIKVKVRWLVCWMTDPNYLHTHTHTHTPCGYICLSALISRLKLSCIILLLNQGSCLLLFLDFSLFPPWAKCSSVVKFLFQLSPCMVITSWANLLFSAKHADSMASHNHSLFPLLPCSPFVSPSMSMPGGLIQQLQNYWEINCLRKQNQKEKYNMKLNYTA